METLIFLILKGILGAILIGAALFSLAITVAIGWLPILACYVFGSTSYCNMANYALFVYAVVLGIPSILGGVLLLIVKFRTIMKWMHFVFVRHPADRYVTKAPSLDTARQPLDVEALGRDLQEGQRKMASGLGSENMVRKAEKHTERVRKETELLDEAIKREVKRTEYEWRRRS